MKSLIIICDGMADYPIAQLGDKTPLEAANSPFMDILAQKGRVGLVQTIPNNTNNGSDVANLAILGYDTNKINSGRAAFEATGMGLTVTKDDLYFRLNLINIEDDIITNHTADYISSNQSKELIKSLNDELGNEQIEFIHGSSYRNLLRIKGGSKNISCTLPHEIIGKNFNDYLPKANKKDAFESVETIKALIFSSQKLLKQHPINKKRVAENHIPANGIWLWSPSNQPNIESLTQKYPIKRGAVIAGVDVIKGIGKYAGLEIIDVEGATGYYDTNYEGKAETTIHALENNDFVYLHIESADEAGHAGDSELKKKTIEQIDARVIKPILEAVEKWKDPISILLLPDHATPCQLRTHTSEAVPFIFYNKLMKPDSLQVYNEKNAAKGSLGLIKVNKLMNFLFSKQTV